MIWNLVEKQLFAQKAHFTISSRLLLAPGEDWGLVPGRKVEHALVSLLTEIAQSLLLRVTDVKEPPSNCDPIRRIIVLHDFFFFPKH